MKKALIYLFLVFYATTFGQTPGEGVTDIDGNEYTSVILGGQEWMTENLRVTRYGNGDSIPQILDDPGWNGTSEGAFCWFNNNPLLDFPHGKLYNWYAVMDSRQLCPTGWRTPSESEFDSLILFLDSTSTIDTINTVVSLTAGGHLKQLGTNNWASPNTDATNSTNFSAIGSGSRHEMGWFVEINTMTFFWCTTSHTSNPQAIAPRLFYNTGEIAKYYQANVSGMSVRCMKDYEGSGVGIIENDFGGELLLYPNPNDGNFSIDLGDTYQNVTISIVDLNGKLILNNTYKENRILKLMFEESAGIYLMIIQSGDKKAIMRFKKD